jgi:pimeloyl-ACP methyl ester carboxylesterase
MSYPLSRRITGGLLLALAMAGATVQAQALWQTLPPTPELPRGTVGKYTTAIDGARIWFSQWGTEAQGVPVLLLHGGEGNSNYFGNLVPILVRHGYRVIAIDSRGHGRSTRTEAPITYHLMAEDVVQVLDRLKIPRVSLVGWSDGGCIGFDLAINHPERLARLFAFGADADVSGLKDDGANSPVFRAYLARVRDEYRRLSPTPDQWEYFDAAINQMWYSLPAYTADQLRSIPVPTTVADGEYDEGIRPEHVKYIAATIPHARLVIIPDVSHFAMLQNPKAFGTAVLDFLRRD